MKTKRHPRVSFLSEEIKSKKEGYFMGCALKASFKIILSLVVLHTAIKG